MKTIEHVKFWCFKVLPLVYDDSLSYYEILCKMNEKLNEMIDNLNELDPIMKSIQAAIAQIEYWIEHFDTTFIEKWIQDNLARMIFVGINDDGYITYYIPQNWNEITFNTTGLDIDVDMQPEYGHLVLSY